MATIYEDDNRDLKASCPEGSARSAYGPTALVESKIRARHPCRNCGALLEGDALGDLPERCPCCGEWLDWRQFAGQDREV